MRYILIILSCMIGLLPSCKKAELQKYSAGDAIYFYSIDSINYSFANKAGILASDTIFIPMQILGPVKKYSRSLQLKATTGTTAQANVHYSLPTVVVKANANTVAYPVIVFNTPDLNTNTASLRLEVIENTDFPQGAGIINNGIHFTSFKINYNNTLIKPSYWGEIQGHFGQYSNVKYKFMIDTFGKSEFPPSLNSYSEYLTLKATISKALQEHEVINGPLIDENKNKVTFPN